MTMIPREAQRYLERSRVNGPWMLQGDERTDYYGAVVIPSLAEGERLFTTLRSLAVNKPGDISRFLVVVVINQGEHAPPVDKRQNLIDLDRLRDFAARSNLCLAWIDAASQACELPEKQAGVGMARKLGMDLALLRLDWTTDPVLVCLDADTLVESNYLQTIIRHFRRAETGAAVLPFRHQPVHDPARQAAIDRYELFLRSYVYGLRLAASPYAFNSVGSAMACRSSAYVRCGGMNCRKAGEDFYFLQKLAKTAGIECLSGTTVYPEARVSERVPFGTGRSMSLLLGGDTRVALFYPAAVFRVLAEWLNTVASNLFASAEQLLTDAGAISPVLAGYLERLAWGTVWPRLQSNHQNVTKLLSAFHAWFDGFRTMRLIHLLCESGLHRGEPMKLLPGYFAWEGRPCPETLSEMLETLRRIDGGSPRISLSQIQ